MKKSVRSTLVKSTALLLALIAVAGFYFFQSNASSGAKTPGAFIVLPDLRPNDVLSISILQTTPTNRIHAVLVKKDGNWFLTSPVKDDADPEAVSSILNGLSGIKSERVFSNIGANGIKDFGFEEPSVVADISNAVPIGSLSRLIAGGRSSDGKYDYVMRGDDSNTVYLVPSGQFSNITKTPNELRSREIFNIDIRDLSRIEWFTAKNGRFHFDISGNDGNDILLTVPKKIKTDSLMVRSKLIGLYSLSISGFLEGKDKKNLSGHGLDKPFGSVMLISKDGRTNILLTGEPDKDGSCFAYIPFKDSIVVINDDDLANKLGMALDDVLPGKVKP